MKKIMNKKVIFGFLLGILVSTITVYAVNYTANEISFTTTKNSNVKNVKDALDDLYANKKTKVLLASNLSSRTEQTVSATSIPNYQNLTEDNFIIEVTGINYAENVSDREVVNSISKSYNTSTGDITVGKLKTFYYNGGNYSFLVYNTYNIYCIY